jgi:hypothetical protein
LEIVAADVTACCPRGIFDELGILTIARVVSASMRWSFYQ